MSRIILDSEKRFKHWDISGKDSRAIEVDDVVAMVLSQNTHSKQYDEIKKTAVDHIKPFVLENEQKSLVISLSIRKKQALNEQIISSALGGEHQYSSDYETLSLINLMISLTNGGNVNCINTGGIEKQRAHTHKHLLRLAQDIIISRNNIYDHLEAKMESVAVAKDQFSIAAVVWE